MSGPEPTTGHSHRVFDCLSRHRHTDDDCAGTYDCADPKCELAALRALLQEAMRRLGYLQEAMRRLGCKCGWENIGKEGYCRPGSSEHESCDFAISARRALEGDEP